MPRSGGRQPRGRDRRPRSWRSMAPTRVRALVAALLVLACGGAAAQDRNINFDLLQAARAGSVATVRALLDQGAEPQLAEPSRRHPAEPGGGERQPRARKPPPRARCGRQPAEPRPGLAADERGLRRPHRAARVAPGGEGGRDARRPGAKDGDGLRRRSGATGCVQALLDHGVDVNQRYANDATALMWAAAYGHVETVKLLLARGADAGATDNRGKTALGARHRGTAGGSRGPPARRGERLPALRGSRM